MGCSAPEPRKISHSNPGPICISSIEINRHHCSQRHNGEETINAHHQHALDHSGEKANPCSVQWARRSGPCWPENRLPPSGTWSEEGTSPIDQDRRVRLSDSTTSEPIVSANEPEQPIRGRTVSDMPQPSNEADAASPLRVERRRPGRMAVVSPHLIPLLRGTTEPLSDLKERGDNDLAPAIGIIVSVLISVVVWAILFSMIWWA